jgi:hypothetical protein
MDVLLGVRAPEQRSSHGGVGDDGAHTQGRRFWSIIIGVAPFLAS